MAQTSYQRAEIADQMVPSRASDRLRSRKREVLQWARRGKSVQQIAEIMHLPLRTVEMDLNTPGWRLIRSRFTKGAYKIALGSNERTPVVSAIEERAFKPDARAQAILRGVRAMQASLAAAGGTYDLEQVQTLLNGISRQAVDKRVQEGNLLAVPGPSNRRAYPTTQFMTDGSVVPGLKAVQQALGNSGPWSVLHFLVSPHDDLGARRPIDLLKAGELSLVLEAARRMDLQGA